MLSSTVALFTFAAAVSAVAIPRASPPKDWWTAGLEDYNQYHTRYMALECYNEHNTDFFASCCHPMLKNELLSSRPDECDPANVCDDEDDSPSSSAEVAATSSVPVNVAPVPTLGTATPTTTKVHHTTQATHSSSSSTQKSEPTSPAPPSNILKSGSGKGTYYTQNGNAGSCGDYHSDSDKVVALDSAIVDGGAWCGKHILITNTKNGKQVKALIADECPTCVSSESVDMSVAAFTAIATEAEGLIDITWQIIN